MSHKSRKRNFGCRNVDSAFVGQAWSDLVIPPGLMLGAGSSASQIEGAWNVDGKSPSTMDTIFQGNASASNANDASKSYELWRTDVELIKNLGLQFYRFSIPWTRILPTGKPDYINQVAVDYYNHFIDALRDIKVEPMVTIFHYDLPQNLMDLGGWRNPEFADWFADYARLLYTLYGDRVKTWLTVNEPIGVCYFLETELFDETQPNLCSKNLLLGHAKAWRVYDKEFRDKYEGQVTIVNNLMWFEAENDDDEPMAELLKQYYGGLYSHPIFSKEGGWPRDLQNALSDTKHALPELTSEEIELMKGTYDFYALNYYTAQAIRKAEENETVGAWPFLGAPEFGVIFEESPKFKISKFEGNPLIYPEGIRLQMKWLNKQYGVTRFVVTENGISNNGTPDDTEKTIYVQDHLKQVALAIEEDGLEVFGYSVWSLIDSFEFISGYEDKFGIYSVDFTHPNRTRTPSNTFYYYKNLIDNAKNGRPTQLVTEDGENTEEQTTENKKEDTNAQNASDEFNEMHFTSSRQSYKLTNVTTKKYKSKYYRC